MPYLVLELVAINSFWMLFQFLKETRSSGHEQGKLGKASFVVGKHEPGVFSIFGGVAGFSFLDRFSFIPLRSDCV